MAHPRMNAEIGRVVDDRYRLVAPIGMGASAKVFLADDVRLLRRVAVKMLHEALAADPVFLHRFRAEAQAAAALSHPNVMAVHDWGDGDLAYIVTEYLGGGSLRAMLDRGTVLSPSQALTIGLEAARALDYAHRRGFVHRDIKPANLLFGDDARLRIADFGLARALAEAAWTEPQGAVLGTARYAAPEQAKGERLSGKADVYALALVLVEAVTGDVPFRADTTLGTLMARVDRPLTVPAELGPLVPILELAGRPDPEDRIDARELAAGLLRAARELPRPEPLPLAGALAPTSPEAPAEQTRHAGVPTDETPSDFGSELTDDDLGLDPPDWVSTAEPAVMGGPAGVDPDASDTADDGVFDVAALDDVADDPTGTGILPVTPAPPGDGGDGGDPDGPDDEPRRRRRLWPVLAILVILAAAAGAIVGVLQWDREPAAAPEPPVELPIPILDDLDESAAVRLLEISGWDVEIDRTRVDDTVAGDVLDSDPAAGDRLEKGGTILLTVSAGQTIVDVPDDLLGRTVAEVNERLEAAGLDSKPAGSRHDEDVPEGSVVALADGTPERIERGSAIGLIVSEGPAPRTVPTGLAGGSGSDAREAIEAVQLQVEVERRFSDDVDEGVVISQSPEGGTLPRGGTVTIIVSDGPEMVKVPDISSAKTTGEASAILRQNGLVPGKASGSAEGSPSGTDPKKGSEVRRGSTVDIILG